MSALTPKRLFLFVAAVLLAGSLGAANPSPRMYARMAYDEGSDMGVLFGGRVGVDTRGSGLAYSSDETWVYSGRRWVQRFPAHTPEARSMHAMAYDSKRDRILMFGGQAEATELEQNPAHLGDTWSWTGDDWTLIDTPTHPGPRIHPGLAYDSARDRALLFGGYQHAAGGTTVESVFDTWEFDGTAWSLVESAGTPKVARPLLAYDPVRDQTLMLGLGDLNVTLMYRFDTTTRTWIQVTPEALPPCVNEGIVTWRSRSQTLVHVGGICTSSTVAETWEWNGTTWTKMTTNDPGLATGQALAYDSRRDTVIMFGGISYGVSSPRSFTLLLRDSTWRYSAFDLTPGARSLAGFRTDAAHSTVWLYGGLGDDGSTYFNDLWRYQNGQWGPVEATGGPGGCTNPLTALDTDRNVMVVVCEGTTPYEWNGTEWKSFTSLKDLPKGRNFAGLVYDQNVKKSVLFGGYDGINYRNDTWTWDGTAWAEVKDNRPTHRGSMAMWYDPLLKKTVVFGGVGRANLDSKIVRYNDMYSFTGSGWTKMDVSRTPGERFGPQVAVDPRNGKVLLFGGLRAEKTGEATSTYVQYYENDLWQWDGSASTWTKLNPASKPAPRENGAFVYDPVANEMVLFGGYQGGLYYSDLWAWDGLNWAPRETALGRRRATGP